MSQVGGEHPESQAATSIERLAEALADALAENERLRRANAELAARVEELEARLGQNPRNWSRPPSSEGYAKPPARRTGGGKRRPGKQPGSGGAHLAQVADPDEVVVHAPPACRDCGAGLGDAPVVGVTTRQVFDLPPRRLGVTSIGRSGAAAPVARPRPRRSPTG